MYVCVCVCVCVCISVCVCACACHTAAVAIIALTTVASVGANYMYASMHMITCQRHWLVYVYMLMIVAVERNNTLAVGVNCAALSFAYTIIFCTKRADAAVRGDAALALYLCTLLHSHLKLPLHLCTKRADAAVEGDEALAAFALAALAKVASVGGEPVAATLDSSNVLPLLHKLASGVWAQRRATCVQCSHD